MSWTDNVPPPEYDYYAPQQQQQQQQPRPVQQQPRPVQQQQQQRPFQNQPSPAQEQKAQQVVRVASQLTDDELKQALLADPVLALGLSRSKSLRERFGDCDIVTFTRFLWLAQKKGADPDNNEIYLVPYWSPQGTKYNIVMSYHWYIAKAMATGLVTSPIAIRTEVIDYFNAQDGTFSKTLCSKASIGRKGYDKLFDYYARYPEFVKTTKDGRPTGQWVKHYYLMLEKCAIACVIRLAFPDIFAGMHVAEEMTETPIDDEYTDTMDAEVMPAQTGAKTLFDEPKAVKPVRPVSQVTQKFD